MTDIELFNHAVNAAQGRQHWRSQAAKGGSIHFTRRQCLHHARQAEARIVNLAILAEQRARRAGA
jgi:hypothetical protein